MKKTISLISWHKPDEKQPENSKTILVVYEDQVWPGVHANGTVALYPEDFPPVKLTDCELWANLPLKPVTLDNSLFPASEWETWSPYFVFKEHPSR